MCARYSLTKDQLTILIGELEVIITLGARYNIAPAQIVPVIVRSAAGYEPVPMRWGFQTPGQRQLLVNAKAETLTTTAFKAHLPQRCLIPADGFYEWAADKTPIRFSLPEEQPFCFAGLWQAETASETSRRCVILTTSPNETVARVHNRMPLIVPPSDYARWLGDGFEPVLQAPERPALNSRPVNRALNHVRNEGPELLRAGMVQADLF